MTTSNVTATYNAPEPVEGRVIIDMSETEAAKLLALITKTTTRNFTDLYAALNKLQFSKLEVKGEFIGGVNINLSKITFEKV